MVSKLQLAWVFLTVSRTLDVDQMKIKLRQLDQDLQAVVKSITYTVQLLFCMNFVIYNSISTIVLFELKDKKKSSSKAVLVALPGRSSDFSLVWQL